VYIHLMGDQGEAPPSGWMCLHVNTGQIVTPPHGIVELEPVLAFVMGSHARLGGASPIIVIGRGGGELFRLVLGSAGLWRELDPWVVMRTRWPGDTAGFYVTNGESSDERFGSLVISDMGALSRTYTARYLERYFMEIGNITGAPSRAIASFKQGMLVEAIFVHTGKYAGQWYECRLVKPFTKGWIVAWTDNDTTNTVKEIMVGSKLREVKLKVARGHDDARVVLRV
jgi:hypothetical protein